MNCPITPIGRIGEEIVIKMCTTVSKLSLKMLIIEMHAHGIRTDVYVAFKAYDSQGSPDRLHCNSRYFIYGIVTVSQSIYNTFLTSTDLGWNVSPTAIVGITCGTIEHVSVIYFVCKLTIEDGKKHFTTAGLTSHGQILYTPTNHLYMFQGRLDTQWKNTQRLTDQMVIWSRSTNANPARLSQLLARLNYNKHLWMKLLLFCHKYCLCHSPTMNLTVSRGWFY